MSWTAAAKTAKKAERLPLVEEDARPTFRRERRALAKGIWPVAGCDEAGRGPLAGPVVAAAVILDPARVPRGLNDSKKLDAGGARGALRQDLRDREVAVAFGVADRIDRDNILRASLWALARAVRALPVRPQARVRRRPRPHRLRLRLRGGNLRRRAGDLDRRGVHRRQGDARPADDAARRSRIPAMASSATWATACRSISTR